MWGINTQATSLAYDVRPQWIPEFLATVKLFACETDHFTWDKIQSELSYTCALSMFFLGVERDFTLPQQISFIVFGAKLCSYNSESSKKEY
jgi:hypothetical protein